MAVRVVGSGKSPCGQDPECVLKAGDLKTIRCYSRHQYIRARKFLRSRRQGLCRVQVETVRW
jgi:hypothetical protein